MKNGKLQNAEMKVKGYTNRYEDRYIQRIDGYLLDGKMNYISVSYDEKNEIIDVVATIVHNNYEEKARLGKFCLRYNEGTVYGKKDREYKRLAYFQKAIIKLWEEKIADDFCLTAGLYEMNELPKWLKIIEEENKKQELIVGDADVQKYTKQLAGANTTEKIIDAFEEIFINEDFYIGGGEILADFFNEGCALGATMHKKFEVLLDAVISGKLELEKITSTCERMRESYNYDALAKYETKFAIVAYEIKKIKPEYDWFMKVNEWNDTRTIVDIEKIDAFKDAGYIIELVPEYEEVIMYGVDEQLEGQVSLDEIEIIEEVEEMKNKEVLDLDENLPLGTIVGFRYDVYENDVLVDKMILTGKIVYISDDFNGKYNVETNDKKTYLVYNSDIVTWERPSKKEIKISITGEGRVEDIETTSVADASKNLVRRIAEIKGERYCNKTWITIDVKEFEQPIEFRVDLIESLHGDVSNVLELIIEEKRRECKYVAENKEKCTWIKDTDKFISVREELIEVLEKYLNPAPAPEPVIEVEEEYIPDCRILMQGGKAVDIVEINAYNQNHSSGLAGTKIIKYAQGFFYNSEIENKLSVDQIKKLRECGFDMDKQVAIAKEIVDEFNKQIYEKNNKKMLTLRKVNVIGSEKCEYDIIFAGMNINGIKKYDKDGEQHEVNKGIDADGKIYLSSEYEYLRPLVEEKLKEETLELFKKYKLSEYYVEETGNLCIDTGSMLYKIIDGAPTGDRVKKFLIENKDYDMKLFNDKYVDIPHYIIHRR